MTPTFDDPALSPDQANNAHTHWLLAEIFENPFEFNEAIEDVENYLRGTRWHSDVLPWRIQPAQKKMVEFRDKQAKKELAGHGVASPVPRSARARASTFASVVTFFAEREGLPRRIRQFSQELITFPLVCLLAWLPALAYAQDRADSEQSQQQDTRADVGEAWDELLADVVPKTVPDPALVVEQTTGPQDGGRQTC